MELLAVLGIGSIVAALISWSIAVANHRQAWINGLRDDIATDLKQLELLHYAVRDDLTSGSETSGIAVREARAALLFSYWRVVFRLNRTEKMHMELRQKLDSQMEISERVPDREKVEEVINLTRRILKREWEVTKYGPLVRYLSKSYGALT